MSDDVTQRLAEIEQRALAATRGPWEAHGEGRDDTGESWVMIRGDIHNDGRSSTRVASVETFGFADDETAEASVHGEADAEFIAHARTDVPWLIEHLRAMLRRVDRLTAHQKAGDEGYEQLADELAEAKAAIDGVRTAVETFCHGEQAYAEHQHYCVPILRALDGDSTTTTDERPHP